MQGETADEHVNRRQLAEHANVRGLDADFLACLAKRRLCQRFARIRGAAWKADLSGMPAEPACPKGQWERDAVFARIEQEECRRDSCIGRQVTRRPTLARRHGREAELRVESGKRASKPITQLRLERRNRLHPAIIAVRCS